MALDYFYNIALLVFIIVAVDILMRHGGYHHLKYKIFLGGLIGGAAVLGMLNPVTLEAGPIFDGRSVIISVGAFIGGPVTAVISGTIAIIYRLYIGGVGALVGSSVIVWSVLAGTGYYYLKIKYPDSSTRPYFLLAFGMVVHVGMLGLMLFLPGGISGDVIGIIALPVLTIYPLSTMLLCMLFLDQESYYIAVNKLARRETELKQALEASHNTARELAESQKRLEKYQLLANHARDIILFIRYADGAIIEANQAALETYGYTRQKLIELNITELRAPDTEPSVAVQMEHANEKGILFETLHRRNDRSTFPVEVSSRGVEMDGQRILVSVIRDITDKKAAEQKEKQLREKAEVSSRLAAVGEMAAGIAHEINNPLTAVIGYSELLAERTDIPEDVKEELKIINQSSQRVKEIIKRMLTFARQTKPVKTSVDINNLIDNTLEMRQYVLQTSNIEVVKNYNTHLPAIAADGGQLQQVLLNIIINAEYAMKKTERKGVLILQTNRGETGIVISISDNGPGMSKQVLDKLFQPFFTTKDTGEGTGLGLSLSLGIIHEHGGDLRAESSEGAGSTFIIELPVTVEEIAVKDAHQHILNYATTQAGRILVVDDEPAVLSLVKHVLQQKGHKVDCCHHPEEALRILEKNTYDAIVMDMRMPEMSGLELYDRVKKHWPAYKNRVLLFTGDTSDIDTREHLKDLSLPYIAKPFDSRELAGIVERLLSS